MKSDLLSQLPWDGQENIWRDAVWRQDHARCTSEAVDGRCARLRQNQAWKTAGLRLEMSADQGTARVSPRHCSVREAWRQPLCLRHWHAARQPKSSGVRSRLDEHVQTGHHERRERHMTRALFSFRHIKSVSRATHSTASLPPHLHLPTKSRPRHHPRHPLPSNLPKPPIQPNVS